MISSRKTDSAFFEGIWQRLELLKSGLKNKPFCEQVGLNYETFKKSAQRRTSPDTLSLARIARHFGVDLAWLATGETGPSGPGENLALWRGRRGLSRERLAQSIGTPETLLEQIEQGRVTAAADLLARAARALGVSLYRLYLDDAAQVPELRAFSAASAPGSPAFRAEDYVSVPLTESRIAAGQPILQENDIQDYVLLHIRATRRKHNLVAIRVKGKSMEPVLSSGDIVIIDRDDTEIVKDRIYAVRHEDGLAAKCVESRPEEGKLLLHSYNPEVEPQTVHLIENATPVVGRIVGVWKNV